MRGRLLAMRDVLKLGAFWLGLWSAFAASFALAQGTPDTTLFGPKQYVLITTSGDNRVTEHFSIPAGVAGPFLLRVQNGNANGTQRATDGEIEVNGVKYATGHDFGATVALIERPLKNLRPTNNEMRVEVKKPVGGRFTLTVLGTRILPVPTSLSPNPLSITAGASGNLTATIAPAPGASGVLSVSSANGAIASVPASVAFAAGQTQVVIPVRSESVV